MGFEKTMQEYFAALDAVPDKNFLWNYLYICARLNRTPTLEDALQRLQARNDIRQIIETENTQKYR
jgi:hypothetical protein